MRSISISPNFGQKALLSGVAMLALAAPGLAAAQDAPATAPGAQTTQTTEPAPAADTPPSTGAGDIVVTARNREERLQDVPLSITAFNSQALSNANVRNLRDISYLTPGLSITSGGSEFGVNPIIRGQTNLNGGGGDPNVSVFLDGIYISNNTAINVGLIDIERVEVVKGPVSALYGRNAFAGAINYVSKRPSITEPHASATGFVGNDGQYSFTGVLSYPLIKDVLGVRVAAGYEHFDGSYQDEVNGNKAGGFEKRDMQASLYFTPTPEFSVSAAYYYGVDTFGLSAIAYNAKNCGVRTTPPTAQDVSGTGFAEFCGRFDPDQHPVEVPTIPGGAGASGNDRKVNLASLNVSYDFGFARITSLTGYTKIDQQRYTDFIARRSGIPFLLTPGPGVLFLQELFGSNTNNKDFSQELRIQSAQDQPFRWQLGGFYYKGRTFGTTIVGIGGAPIPAGQQLLPGFPRDSYSDGAALSTTRITQTLSHDRQLSGFVAADYDVFDGLTVSGEYRYTDQKKDQIIIRNVACPSTLTVAAGTCTGPAPTPYLFPNGTTPAERTFRYDNFRATVKYAVTPGTNVYASIADGLKSGGFNQRSTSILDRSYDPETNTTYEIGIKNSLFDNRLQFNVSLYHIKTKGIQISGPSADPNNPGLVITNFGSVKTNGFEAELAAKLADGVRVNVGVAHADPEFGDDAFDFGAANASCFLIPQCAARIVVAAPGTPLNPVGPPLNTTSKNVLRLGGLSVPRTPHWMLNAGVDLEGPIQGDWKWTATYNARYEDRQYGFNNNISYYGPRTIMNVRAGVDNGMYSASLYVNNLTDDHTPEIVSVNARLSDFQGDLNGYLPVGRQYGLTLGAKF
ncbi:TonB-dependent receptor [Sphingomonas sp. SUN019]|uniref:TonB-dependent receptor n=1 Tax=Sphingomonas sp. SUN019 TaxID=2937788 RepID=UPI0021646153|nr:TonB-dependent receptor [Sphingomonas sp. SUN019]UVO50496.1 TonB-dependent receptor [Sphingomonas sp. SUN019]